MLVPMSPCCAITKKVVTPRRRKVGEQLVKLNREEAFVGHGVHVAVEAVDDDDLCVILFNGLADNGGEFAGRYFGGIHLLDAHLALLQTLREAYAEAARARFKCLHGFIERKYSRMVAALGRGDGVLDGDCGFADARGTEKERARSAVGSSAEEGVEFLDAAFNHGWSERLGMLGGDETRKDIEAAGAYAEIVISPAILRAAELDDAESAAFRTVLGASCSRAITAWAIEWSCLSEPSAVRSSSSSTVHCAPDEELLEGENLPPVTQGILREQTHFRERVEYQSLRLDALHRIENRFGGFA